MPQDPKDLQIQRLSLLLQVQQRAQNAAPEELPFIIVNETRQLLVYRQAVLWTLEPETYAVQAVSGVAVPDKNAPFLLWLKELCRAVYKDAPLSTPQKLTKKDIPEALHSGWQEWLPEHGFISPLLTREQKPIALLGLFRQEAFSPAEQHVLGYLVSTYGLCLHADRTRKKSWNFLNKKRRLIGACIFVACLILALFPVRESALSPAVVASSAPCMIRSPLQGVVDSIAVAPNQMVTKDTLLLTLDDKELKSRLAVATKTYEIAQEEYLQVSQQAISSAEAKAKTAILQARLEQQRTEAQYLHTLLQRVDIRAPMDGVAVFDDPDDWIGRPVSLGETLLMVSSPKDVLLEIHVPAEDAISLKKGTEVLFFLNIAPMQPIPATVTYASYTAEAQPEGYLAYRVEATFSQIDDPRLRIGLRGTAKIYGQQRSLALILLRKPLTVLRQWLGV